MDRDIVHLFSAFEFDTRFKLCALTTHQIKANALSNQSHLPSTKVEIERFGGGGLGVRFFDAAVLA